MELMHRIVRPRRGVRYPGEFEIEIGVTSLDDPVVPALKEATETFEELRWVQEEDIFEQFLQF